MSFLGLTKRELSGTNIIFNPQGREENTMKKATIEKAVKSINRSIRFYQRKLTYQLELKAEEEFHNGNLHVANSGEHDMDIAKYQIILADLATIKRAIKNGKLTVTIYGTLTHGCYLYIETTEALEKAGFETDSDGDNTIRLLPIEEWQEELREEESRFMALLNPENAG